MMVHRCNSSKQNMTTEIADSISLSSLSLSLSLSLSTSAIAALPQSPLMTEQEDDDRNTAQQQHQQKQSKQQRRKGLRYQRRGLDMYYMTGTTISLLLSIILLRSSSSLDGRAGIGVVLGFPSGAGGCEGGTAAVGGSHLDPSKNIEQGDLAFGGITFSINGVDILPSDPVLDFPLNQDMEVVVIATFPDVLFRGILIRMQVPSSYTDDTTNLLIPSSPDVKVADVCTAPVRGITHINRGDKETASGTVNFPLEALGVIFDVTAVFANDASSSAYVYSRMIANFRNATTDAPTPSVVTTPAPSTTGTLITVTETPTVAPVVGNVTGAPVLLTSSPTVQSPVFFTLSPTITALPTITAVPNADGTIPTKLPTATPTAAPIVKPTRTQPTDFPTITLIPTITGIPTASPLVLDSDLPSIVPTTKPLMMMMMSEKGKGMMMMMMKMKSEKGKGMMMMDSQKGKGMMMMSKNSKGKGMMMMDPKGKGMMKSGKGQGKVKDKTKKQYYSFSQNGGSSDDDATTYTDDYGSGAYNDDYGTNADDSYNDDTTDDYASNYDDGVHASTDDDTLRSNDDDYNVDPNHYKVSLYGNEPKVITRNKRKRIIPVPVAVQAPVAAQPQPVAATTLIKASPTVVKTNSPALLPKVMMMKTMTASISTTEPATKTAPAAKMPTTSSGTKTLSVTKQPTQSPTLDILIGIKDSGNIFYNVDTKKRVQSTMSRSSSRIASPNTDKREI